MPVIAWLKWAGYLAASLLVLAILVSGGLLLVLAVVAICLIAKVILVVWFGAWCIKEGIEGDPKK